MKSRKRLNLYIKVITSIFAFIIIILLSFSGVGVTYAAETAFAEESKIISELERITIDGKKFSAADYPADGEGTPSVLYLNEIGYRFAGVQDLYALTLYVYNPAQINVVDDVRNQIQMKIGGEERFAKYDLKLEDKSADNLFCKFAVAFKNDEKQAALKALDKDGRVYELSSIELYVDGYNATDFSFGHTRVYTYTGYAKGLGANVADESTLAGTLSYTVAGGSKVEPISVKHTSWRPEGTNGNSAWTQDTIHSVYFAVPKKYSEQYDYLASVKAEWYEAVTAPILVTQNEEMYNALEELYRQNVAETNLTRDVSHLNDKDGLEWAFHTKAIGTTFDYYNEYFYGTDEALHIIGESLSLSTPPFNSNNCENLKQLPLFMLVNSYDNGVVTSTEITENIARRNSDIPSTLLPNTVAGKYQERLFTSYDTGKTVKIIKANRAGADEGDNESEIIVNSDKLILHSEEVKRTLRQNIFGGSSTSNEHDFEGIDPIQLITDNDVDLKWTNKQISDNLHISERDVKAFKDFYDDNSKDSEIYLMRFAVSEYWVQPTYLYRYSNVITPTYVLDGAVSENPTSYLVKEKAYLDFDLIDFKYVKDDESYVIPVSMSPIDIFPELTPPPVYEDNDLWKYGLAVIGGLVVVWIVYGIISRQVKKRGDTEW